MKKNIKVIVAGVVVAVIGLVVLLCALGMSGWSFSRVNDWQEDTFSSDAAISKLKVQVNVGQVYIQYGSVENVRVKYEFNDNYQPQISERAGVLTVETARTQWYDFGLWFGNAPTIEITVPHELKPQIDLEVNAGTANLGDGDWGNYVKVELNAGKMSIGDVIVGELYVGINAGELSANKIQCDKLRCYLSAGKFNATDIACDEFYCELSAGRATVNRLGAYNVTIELSAGKVNLGLVGEQTDYNVRVSKSAGKCNVSNRTDASASRRLDVDLSAGTVNVSFGK